MFKLITKLENKIDVHHLLTKKAAKTNTERSREYRRRQTDDKKKHEQEAAKMRMRKLRGKVVDNATAEEMEEVQVHACPVEVETNQDEGLEMKRFECLILTLFQSLLQDRYLR